MDQLLEADNGLGEVIKPPEKSFWAKYVSCCSRYLFTLTIPSVSAYSYVSTFPFNLTCCFAVDVHYSSWSHCHECRYGSCKHTRGTSSRAGPTWSTTSTSCCCKEKMIAVMFFNFYHVIGIICLLSSYSFLCFILREYYHDSWSVVLLVHDDVVFCLRLKHWASFF